MKKLLSTLMIAPLGLVFAGDALAQRSPAEIAETNAWTERLGNEQLRELRQTLRDGDDYVVLTGPSEREVDMHPLFKIVPTDINDSRNF